MTVQGIVLDKDQLEGRELKVGDRYEATYTLYGPSLQGKDITWTTRAMLPWCGWTAGISTPCRKAQR
ncbi:MAG: hypothetical protein V8R55_08900 [Dysosmobacter sp.]